jgi:hypothetical protein
MGTKFVKQILNISSFPDDILDPGFLPLCLERDAVECCEAFSTGAVDAITETAAAATHAITDAMITL